MKTIKLTKERLRSYLNVDKNLRLIENGELLEDNVSKAIFDQLVYVIDKQFLCEKRVVKIKYELPTTYLNWVKMKNGLDFESKTIEVEVDVRRVFPDNTLDDLKAHYNVDI